MPLPVSRNQVDRLGKRLAAADEVADADLTMLQQVLAAYDEVKVAVLDQLETLGYTATGRTKTTGTLIDKLRRHQSMALSRVQDIAGARLIVAGTRRDQDEAVAQIVAWFRSKGCKISGDPVDRRATPSSGYRAVHVIVVIDGLSAEIQVRTELQDLWAQAFERLGDRWGRAIRYGGEPDSPDAPALADHPELTRRRMVEAMAKLSDQIHEVELNRVRVLEVRDVEDRHRNEEDSDEYQALATDLRDAEQRLAVVEDEFRGTLRVLVRFATQGA